MKTEFFSSFAIAPYIAHGQMNQWSDNRFEQFCKQMCLSYLHALRREVPGEWPQSYYCQQSHHADMQSALMSHVIRARANGLSMEHITDRMLDDVHAIVLFGLDMHNKMTRMSWLNTYYDPVMFKDTRFHMELIFGDIDQKRCNFHVITMAPIKVDILAWLASDPPNVMPCLLIRLDCMNDSRLKTMSYFISCPRINDGIHAFSHIPPGMH